jgi:molecular chaperone DnaK
MAHLGIDLGTSNTLVARLSPSGEPEILPIGDKMIPSCIYIEQPAGHPVVGKDALDMWADPQYDVAYSFRGWKPAMGEKRVLATLRFEKRPPIEVTPEYLTTLIVEYVVGELSRGMLGGETIESVLVTVPHGWRRENPEKCRATRLAAAQAKVGNKNITVQELTVSEPVAAAAYWLWEARKKGLDKALQHKTVLVCDIGGGTFDLSLVRVGGEEKPLDVVDAVNNNIAGDYVDALLLAWVCRQFNERFHTDYPTTAQGILAQLPQMPKLREWYLGVQKMKHTLSDRIRGVITRGRGESLKPVKGTFVDLSGHTLIPSLSLAEFETCVEPFYAAGRELIRDFLTRNREQLPYAVLLAGGGSRMAGVREHILEPALRHFFDPQEASAVLDRISVNTLKTDEVIALGAALIANGVVSVQERLLNDVGLIAHISAPLAGKLGLSPQEQQVLIIPILPRGTPLPAVFKSTDLGLPTSIAEGKELELALVVDDDSADPWVQCWTLSHPGGGQPQSVEWEMRADMDGALTLRLQPVRGRPAEVVGRLERTRVGRAHLIVGEVLGQGAGALPRVTPQQLRQAFEQLKHSS